MAVLDRIAELVDSSPISRSTGAVRVRRAAAVLFFVYGLLVAALSIRAGNLPAWTHVALLMMAVALFTGRGGRFFRDWIPVFLGVFAYAAASQFAQKLDFTVHYSPQIEADRLLGLGTLPTVWLQEHLYGGATGPLEVFSLLMYVSHFFVPLALGFWLWWSRRSEAFCVLMFGILVVSLLGEITFVLAPTAPPWLASEQALIPHVHEIVKQSLYDLDLTTVAALKGSAASYNVVAAVPSLHAAWPVIGLLVVWKYGLPRWAFIAQAIQLVAVFFAIVYTGEHYAIDAVIGAAYALGAWWLVRRALQGNRRARGTVAAVPQLAVGPESHG